MSEYTEDIRQFRRTKQERKADWLDWRKGKFSQDELASVKQGLEIWLEETCDKENCNREEALTKLKWARDNKVTAWCEVAHHSSLPKRKIGSIRHCVLRNFLAGSEMSRWSAEETAEFRRLQTIYGPRSWKDIAMDTGRTLEDVINKGRQLASVGKSKSNKSLRFSRCDVTRIKLKKLLQDEHATSPYELQAIRSDCKLVCLIRKYHFPSGDLHDVYYIPAAKIARKLNSAQSVVRVRWHRDILPSVVSSVTLRLDDQQLLDAYLVLRAHRACKGKLTDIEGNVLHTAYDWDSLDLQALVPLWPHDVTKNRLSATLKSHPKYDLISLPKVIKSVKESFLKIYPREEIYSAALAHFAEVNRMVNVIADRGDDYLEMDKIESNAITEIIVSD
jgi:hypothetical protein